MPRPKALPKSLRGSVLRRCIGARAWHRSPQGRSDAPQVSACIPPAPVGSDLSGIFSGRQVKSIMDPYDQSPISVTPLGHLVVDPSSLPSRCSVTPGPLARNGFQRSPRREPLGAGAKRRRQRPQRSEPFSEPRPLPGSPQASSP